jgi:hypothetical protein
MPYPFHPDPTPHPDNDPRDDAEELAERSAKRTQTERARLDSGMRQLHLRVEAPIVTLLDELIASAKPGFWDRSSLVAALIESEHRRAKRRKPKPGP